MIEHVLSENTGDWFTLDFHQHKVRDAGKNVDARQLSQCICYASHLDRDEFASFTAKPIGHVKTRTSDMIGHGVD
jgi:hypothetical protein